MRFIATMEHTPDNCWARDENEEIASEWIGSASQRAEEHGIDLLGAYAAPNEHTIYFVVESDSFEAVSEYLGSPFLEDHDGDVVPVLTFGQVEDSVLSD